MEPTNGWTPLYYGMTYYTTPRVHVSVCQWSSWSEVDIHYNPLRGFSPFRTQRFFSDEYPDHFAQAIAWAEQQISSYEKGT